MQKSSERALFLCLKESLYFNQKLVTYLNFALVVYKQGIQPWERELLLGRDEAEKDGPAQMLYCSSRFNSHQIEATWQTYSFEIDISPSV